MPNESNELIFGKPINRNDFQSYILYGVEWVHLFRLFIFFSSSYEKIVVGSKIHYYVRSISQCFISFSICKFGIVAIKLGFYDVKFLYFYRGAYGRILRWIRWERGRCGRNLYKFSVWLYLSRHCDELLKPLIKKVY